MLQFKQNANEIIKGLWLGDAVSALDDNFHKVNNISVVVNCSKNIDFNPNILYKYLVPVDDNLQADQILLMVKYINKILPIVHEHMKNNRVVLIHCMAGMQRSAIIVLAYLYKYKEQDIYNCINMMKRIRPIVFTPTMNFKYSICKSLDILF